ncbi:MAG: DUF4350 domain-containing protein [Clostridia bacterium]|nr:DUF4350 domain-containing protein [Clostridia bacterium]
MKFNFRRLLSLVLCLCMICTCVLGSLSACTKDGEDDNPDSGDQPEVPLITLVDGTTEYTVYRPDITIQEVINAAAKLRTCIEAATGVAIGISDDYVPRGEEVPTDTCDILVGLTNRAESTQIHATLAEGEYAIQMVGKRLVIVGYDDDCTIAAVEYFIDNILGYNEEANTYAVTKIELAEDYAQKGIYTPEPVVIVPPTYETIYGEQNKPTVSPATYIRPYYELENGLYVQSYDSFDLQGVRTTFQASVLYTDTRAVNADSVMVYSTSGENFATWYESEDYVVDMMIAINRADASYLDLDKDNYNDIQMDSSGNYLEHPAGGSYYMVPSEDWIEFAWYEMLLPMIEQYHPQTIALEEPEMWIRAGYSQTFKDEWEEFYGEEWEAPNSSAAANLKANLLKTYLFERILTELSKRVKEVSPNTQIYIATHSTVNYAAWSITAGLNTYLALDVIDGVIGQTWADTHNSAFPYNGSNTVDNFTNAFIEYCSYVDSVEGTNFYALADPVMDSTTRTEEGCQYFYRQSIAAQLMQPEINRFQILPWVQRAFGSATSAYRTVQSQIFAMLNDIGGEEITMTAGTPGISYLASDSLSWMNTGSGWSLNPTDGMYGLCAPLVRDGVPVKMKAMEQIYTADDLEDVTLLLASYDTSVPLSEEVNIAIADWVKAGGTLLYISGHNQYWDIDDYFFWADDVTPLYNLLRHLGLEEITVNTGDNNGIKPSSRLSATVIDLEDTFDNHALSSYASYAITFDGAENPVMKIGNKVIGFEESVGEGNVVVMGIPTAAFAQYKGGSTMLRTLVEYALQYTEYEYVSSDLMITERGKYVIAHAFDEPVELEGTYINLFDENLAILVDPVVPKEDSLILINTDNFDLSIPRLGFSSGEVDDATLSESANTTTYQFTSATNTIICNRLLAPTGTYPQSVTVTDQNGTEKTLLSILWDDDTHSLRFTVDGSREPLTVTVKWGNEKGKLEGSSYVYEEINIAVNNKEADKEYVHSSTAATNDTCRFCDLDRQLIYRFDTTDYNSPIYQFDVAQNYIIEVSGDGENWEMIADYSEGGTVEHIKDADNATIFTIDPTNYESVEETGILYVRFRNSNTSMGWGARVSMLTIRHLVEMDADAGESTDWLTGKNNTSSIDDDAMTVPTSTAQTEAKYLVKTENGVSTYKRRVNTNTSNEDIDFIILNTAQSNANIRYCDNERQLIYCFDVSEMLNCELTFRVYQNYIVEVSNDNENWEIIANYYDISGGKHLTTGGNEIDVDVNPDDFDCDETGECYVRIRNCDTSKGWGGTIRYFDMNYSRAAK